MTQEQKDTLKEFFINRIRRVVTDDFMGEALLKETNTVSLAVLALDRLEKLGDTTEKTQQEDDDKTFTELLSEL